MISQICDYEEIGQSVFRACKLFFQVEIRLEEKCGYKRMRN
jgi:hypothetical protein